MKKISAVVLSLALVLSLAACGGASSRAASSSSSGEPVELYLFAAASMTETLDEIIAQYRGEAPNVTVVPTYDSSGTLLKQIQAGADCDLFLSASPKQMNALDGAFREDTEKNPEGLDLIDTATRLDLLENRVALAVPEGNPKGIGSFDRLAELLQNGGVLLAVGNSDVPVGQYAQRILAFYGLDEAALARSGVLTYGSNVKEVVTQVKESAVDCGIIYATDARSAGLAAVDSADAEMCGQVIYPAAVLKSSAHPAEAKAFLDYLASPAAGEIFEAVGFTAIGK